MARINLLPWREELRRERQRQFMISTMMTAILGVVLVFLVGLIFDQKIRHQEERNQVIQSKIAQLQVRIQRINQLEETRDRLISRKRIIEELQASRSKTVELLDKLAKTIPVGVTLASVRQQGDALDLQGTSQSNARVSAYLQSLEADDLFENPELRFVRASERNASPAEPYEFHVSAKSRSKTAEEVDEEELGYDTEGVTDAQ
jgi:type IV pilus assembly protein PilN